MSSAKHYVGLDLTSFKDNGKSLPISRVTLSVDEENVITAGDDTGREIISECPYATQEMVNSLLQRLKGYRYQMFEAEAANLDPAAELGDGLTADGVYCVISRIQDDGNGYPGITAPGESELEEEYPMGDGPMMQQLQKKFAYQEKQLASTRSLITKNSEQIQLMVEQINGQNDKFTSITQTLESITLTATSEGNTATLTLSGTGLKATSANITFTGFVTFNNLSNSGETTINGSNITTGMIKEKKVPSKSYQSYWDLEKGELVTYSMIANDIQATGSFICGGDRYSRLELTAGVISGYYNDVKYSELNVNAALVDERRQTYNGFKLNSNGLAITTNLLAIGSYNSSSATTTASFNNTLKYVGWDEDYDGYVTLYSNELGLVFTKGFLTFIQDTWGLEIPIE